MSLILFLSFFNSFGLKHSRAAEKVLVRGSVVCAICSDEKCPPSLQL